MPLNPTHFREDKTIKLQDFFAIMKKLGLQGFKIAVAVSGGSDSLCLALLLKEWAKHTNTQIVALIVNHKVRSDIEQEILQVQSWLNKHQISNYVLDFLTNIPSNNHNLLREKRYETLINFCKTQGINYLFLGHHLDDVIETYIMRNTRKVNIFGLSSISFVVNRQEVLIVRPLLFYSKVALQNTLKLLNQSWVEDPSNSNLKYERARVREQLKNKNTSEYADIIFKERTKRVTLEQDLCNFLAKYVKVSRLGEVIVAFNKLMSCPSYLQITIIRTLLKFISGKAYMPKVAKVAAFISSVQQDTFTTYTLGGALIQLYKNGCGKDIDGWALSLVKEARAINHRVAVAEAKDGKIFWDNRFLISGVKHYPEEYFFAKLNTNAYNYSSTEDALWLSKLRLHLNKYLIISIPWLFNGNGTPVWEWAKEMLCDGNSGKLLFFPYDSLFCGFFCNFSFNINK